MKKLLLILLILPGMVYAQGSLTKNLIYKEELREFVAELNHQIKFGEDIDIKADALAKEWVLSLNYKDAKDRLDSIGDANKDYCIVTNIWPTINMRGQFASELMFIKKREALGWVNSRFELFSEEVINSTDAGTSFYFYNKTLSERYTFCLILLKKN